MYTVDPDKQFFLDEPIIHFSNALPHYLSMSTHNSHKLLEKTLSDCTKRDHLTMVIYCDITEV